MLDVFCFLCEDFYEDLVAAFPELRLYCARCLRAELRLRAGTRHGCLGTEAETSNLLGTETCLVLSLWSF